MDWRISKLLSNHQCESQVSVVAQIILGLEIDEIAVTIDERSDVYTVGDKVAAPRVIPPHARDTVRTMSTPLTSYIQAMRRKEKLRSNPQKKTEYKRYQEAKPTAKNNQICKACFDLDHFITNPDTTYCNLAKQQMGSKYLETAENTSVSKPNKYRYKKDRKENHKE